MSLRTKNRGGTWYTVGRFLGVRVCRSTFLQAEARFKPAAVQKRHELEAEILAGNYQRKTTDKTVFDAFDEHMENRHSTSDAGFYTMKDFVKRFGRRKLNTLQRDECQAWLRDYFYDEKTETWKWKTSSIVTELRIVKGVLNQAYEDGYLKRKIRFKLPPMNDGREEYLTADEAKLVMANEPKQVGAIFSFMICTGSRLAEAVRARWSDVDFEENLVRLTTRKGDGSWRERYVPLIDSIRQRLTDMKADRLKRSKGKPVEDEHVFLNCYGRPYNQKLPSNLMSHYWIKLRKKLGITRDVKVHDLRHTFGTHLGENNVDILTIANLLGHTNIKRAARYVHESKAKHTAAVKGLPF